MVNTAGASPINDLPCGFFQAYVKINNFSSADFSFTMEAWESS